MNRLFRFLAVFLARPLPTREEVLRFAVFVFGATVLPTVRIVVYEEVSSPTPLAGA